MKWLVLAMVAVSASQANIHVYKPVPMENSFYELECPYQGEFQYWLLHGQGEALLPTETTTYEELTVFKNGSIIFKRLKVEHAGVHICLWKVGDNNVTAHTVPLEVRPLPPTNLWADVYQSKFLTGLIAALVCFSLFALTCLVYNRRWRPNEKEIDVSPIIENGYDNPAMIGGEEDASSTKM